MTAAAEKHCILTISCLDARNIENVVLTRSVRYHVEHRFLLNGIYWAAHGKVPVEGVQSKTPTDIQPTVRPPMWQAPSRG